MDFDGTGTYAQRGRNLLCVQAPRGLLQHLTLAACETAQLLRICALAVMPLYAALFKCETSIDGRT